MIAASQSTDRGICVFSSDEMLFEKTREAIDATANFKLNNFFEDANEFIEFAKTDAGKWIFICDLNGNHSKRLKLIAEIDRLRSAPMIVVASERLCFLASDAVAAGADCFLIKPVRAGNLIAGFAAAVALRVRRMFLQSEIENLQRKIAERKIIERAKGILMSISALPEESAFKLLQKRSQDSRRPLVEIARAVIESNEIFGRDRSAKA